MAIPDGQRAQNDLPGRSNFQQLFDEITIGVFAINKDGMISYANDTAEVYTGIAKGHLVGKYFFELFLDAVAGAPNKAKVLSQQEVTDKEFAFDGATGKARAVLLTSKLYQNVQGTDDTYLFLRDISTLKKKEQLFIYLNKAATELVKARDTQTALEQIALFIVPKFANWFTVDVLEGDSLKLLLLKHEDPEKIKWAYEYRKAYPPDLNGTNGTALAIKTGKQGFAPDVTDAMIDASVPDPVQRRMVQHIGLRSVIIVPIFTKDAITGVVNFISSEPDRLFDETDLDFAQNFANLIGLALENARLNEAVLAELALRKQSEEQFRFLADVIPHKMWTADPAGRATYYNRGWYDYNGAADFDELREKIWDSLHPEDLVKAEIEYPMAIAAGKPMEMEQRLRRHDGTYRWHLTRFSAHADSEGKILLWVGTSTDIHEQKEAHLEVEEANAKLSFINEELALVNHELYSANEELITVNEESANTNEELLETQLHLERTIEENNQLYIRVKELNEKKDEFIGLASHELKTPLTSIHGYLQILDRMVKEGEVQKFVTRTLQQVQKLTALVNDLLDVSKIEAGKLVLSRRITDMRKIVEDAVDIIRHTNNRYEIKIETTVASRDVMADGQRIEQVLLNLINNAIKYSPGENEVVVGLSSDKSNVTISVRDFGVGIPEDKRTEIFSRFYRVEDGNPNISGLGIGLYISFEIVSRHGGKLWVESNTGRGSTFYFTLPLEEAE